MDNVGSSGPQGGQNNKPIPLEGGPDRTASPAIKPGDGSAPVSRAPLSLGNGAAAPTPGARPAAAPAAASAPRPAVARAPVPRTVAARAPVAGLAGRITGCKTFFTKLHPGAIDFLDEQINQWLKDNPGVDIRMTNTSVGDVQGKKTEANILLTVWYHGQAVKSESHMG